MRPRIIPARAGFTRPDGVIVDREQDHPRSRGVYLSSPISARSAAGSSPLARGLLVMHRWGNYARRIIPARAGFTDADIRRAYRGGDHPRSRGVYRTLSLN